MTANIGPDPVGGQKSLNMLLGNWNILRAVWYPFFKPNKNIKSFKVLAWKIATTASGEKPGRPVFLKELIGDKVFHASYKDLGTKFIPEDHYIYILSKNGFSLKEKGDGFLVFSALN